MDPQTFSTRQTKVRDQRDTWSEWFTPVIDRTRLEKAQQIVHKSLYSPDVGTEFLCRSLGDIAIGAIPAV